ncbi:TauD/TfdA family dioxygenase [Streptomyces sp. NPDC007100]|uniref:TauD/TfdA family dioxygenase n=1 Tax=unclassified Streptomyces TaxID=2593676 RepID=UPI0033FF5221
MSDLRHWQPRDITPQETGTAPTAEGLIDYIRGNAEFDRLLTESKAIVFRGFHVTEESVESVMELLLPKRLAYVHGNSPRTKVGKNVYTSTEYPPEYTISMHNEMSYSSSWPTRLMFFCAKAPATGGATPVVDGRLWLESLDPEIREAFRGGVRYTQNLHGGRGLGKSWQDTFETDDKDEVERFLRGAEAEWEWLPGDTLRIRQQRRSTITHPETGDEVWFNQSDQWHPAALDDETAAELAQLMPEDELPQSVTLADGTPIPGEWAIQVRDRGLENAVDVDWHEGDVMLIDNLLVGHGRRPFTGPRRILVAMS